MEEELEDCDSIWEDVYDALESREGIDRVYAPLKGYDLLFVTSLFGVDG